jgi:hypothetical protein
MQIYASSPIGHLPVTRLRASIRMA